MSGGPNPKPEAPLLEVVDGVEGKKPEAKAASATPGTASAALEIQESAGVDAAIQPDGEKESEDNTKKKEGQSETVAQDKPLDTPFNPEVSFDIRHAFSKLFEGLDRALTSAYRRGTVLGKIAAAPEGIFYAIYDLLKKKIPKPDSKGADSAAEGEMLNIGPSLNVANNAGGTSAQLKAMGAKLNETIGPAFEELKETSYLPHADETKLAPAAIPTTFSSDELAGKRSLGSLVAASPAGSGSVLPGAAVPIKKAAASTVKKR